MFDKLMNLLPVYNGDIWPVQIVAYLLGLTAIFFAIKKTAYSDRVAAGVLVLLWLWVGGIFNTMYFPRIFPPAIVLAGLFVLQAILFAIYGVFKPAMTFHVKADASGILGGLMMFYAIIGYPIVEMLLGRGYPQTLPFGLVPCPMTTFTLGLLLWADKSMPKGLWILPILFAIGFGSMTAFLVGVIEDAGLVLAGLVTLILILVTSRRTRTLTQKPVGTAAH
jgi:hypothetical protein